MTWVGTTARLIHELLHSSSTPATLIVQLLKQFSAHITAVTLLFEVAVTREALEGWAAQPSNTSFLYDIVLQPLHLLGVLLCQG